MRRVLALSALLMGLLCASLAGGAADVSAQAVSCESFPNQSAAQGVYRQNPAGLRHLDPDNLGIACRALRCPCDFMPVQRPRDLSAALLTAADLPPGWRESAPAPANDGGLPLCGEDLGGGDGDTAPSVRFQRGAGGPVLTQTIPLLPPGAAVYVWERVQEILRPCEWEQVTAAGLRISGSLSPLDLPRIGDDSIALRLELRAAGGAIQGDIVALLRGDAIALIAQLGGVDAPPDTELTLLAARRAERRLASVLGLP